jgi:hypothetical protein
MEKNKMIDLLIEATSELMDSVDANNVADEIRVLDNLEKIKIKIMDDDSYYFLENIEVCDECESLTLNVGYYPIEED